MNNLINANLSDEDNYELVKDWLSVNFNSDDNLVIDQECNNFITLASKVDDLIANSQSA